MGQGSPVVYMENERHAARISLGLNPRSVKTSVHRCRPLISPCMLGSSEERVNGVFGEKGNATHSR